MLRCLERYCCSSDFQCVLHHIVLFTTNSPKSNSVFKEMNKCLNIYYVSRNRRTLFPDQTVHNQWCRTNIWSFKHREGEWECATGHRGYIVHTCILWAIDPHEFIFKSHITRVLFNCLHLIIFYNIYILTIIGQLICSDFTKRQLLWDIRKK